MTDKPKLNAQSKAMIADFYREDQFLVEMIFGVFSSSYRLPIEIFSSVEAMKKQKMCPKLRKTSVFFWALFKIPAVGTSNCKEGEERTCQEKRVITLCKQLIHKPFNKHE